MSEANPNMVKIGDDFYNLNYLVKVAANEDGTVTLVFTDKYTPVVNAADWLKAIKEMGWRIPEIRRP